MKQMAENYANMRNRSSEVEMTNVTSDLESQTLVKTDTSEDNSESEIKTKKGKKKFKRVSLKERMTRFNY